MSSVYPSPSAFLEQEIKRSLSPPMQGPLPLPCPTPSAPQPRELITIEEECERLARELREVGKHVDEEPLFPNRCTAKGEGTWLFDGLYFFIFVCLCVSHTRCPGTETAFEHS